MYERVSGEQGNRDHLLPVTPFVMFGQQWQVDFAALMVKLGDHSLFETISCLYGKPLQQAGFQQRLILSSNSTGNARRGERIATAH